MRVFRTRALACALVAAAVAAAPASAAQVELEPTLTRTVWSPDAGAALLGAGYLWSTSGDITMHGMLQFDLSGIDGDITSATLRMKVLYDPSNIADATELRQIAEPWNSSATWLTGDGTNSWSGPPYVAHGSVPPTSYVDGWVEWDAFAWVYGNNHNPEEYYGIRLENWAGNGVVYFYDENSAYPPKLIIEY
jgi:opacity protein-like surface antigen